MEPLEPRLLLSGVFASPAAGYATGKWPTSVISADFNGDGKADLAVANASGNTVSILMGSGGGTFAAKVDYATNGPQCVIVGDFNGDGEADLAVTDGGGNTVSILLGHGDGTFADKVDYATGAGPYSVTTADFNGDGHADLAVANVHDNTVSVLLGQGDGTFAGKVDYATGASPYSVTTADFNGDGHADLAVANYNDSTVSILLGDGGGAFAAKVDHVTGGRPLSVISADFNGDGKADLAVANYNASTVSILLGQGNGDFAAKVDYATGAGPYCVISADFNGDGKADLAVTNYNSNTVSILLGSGAGTFAAEGDYATGSYPISATSADFNGDGKADLAVANVHDNTLSVLLQPVADVTPPGSGVYTNSTTFTVDWWGSGGAGIAGYNVYVSDNGGTATLWQSATTDTSAVFTGADGHTYTFSVVGIDNVGNEQSPPLATLATTVDTTLPTSRVTRLRAKDTASFPVAWSGQDTAGGAGIASYTIYVSDNGGAFIPWLTDTTQISATYDGQVGDTYSFYSLATDNAGNVEAAKEVFDATTTTWQTESKTLTKGRNSSRWSFLDFDGTRETITYSGNGQAVVERWKDSAGKGDIRNVTITGDNGKGTLTITTTGRGTAALTSVEDLIVHGSLKSIRGKTTSLLGNVTVDGTLGSLTMDDATSGSTISIGLRPPVDTRTATTLAFDQVAEMSMDLKTPVRSLAVTQWLDDDGTADVIKAPYIATLTVKGDKKRALAGNFQADLDLWSQNATGISLGTFKAIGTVADATWTLAGGAGTIIVNSSEATWTASFGHAGNWANVRRIASVASVASAGHLSGSFTANSIGTVSASGNLENLDLDLRQAPDAKRKALGTLSAKGWIDSSQIRVNGTISTVKAGGIRGSSIFAGVNAVRDVDGVGGSPDNVLDLPETGDLAGPVGNLLAAIKAVTVTGIKAGKTYVLSFINSNIAAGSLGKISLRYASPDNDGNLAAHDVPFGLTTATTSAFGLTYKDADKTHAYKWNTADGASLPSWCDDFTLRLV